MNGEDMSKEFEALCDLLPADVNWGEQHKQSSEGDRFIGRDVREIEALAAKGLREDGLPD